jgi:hypothetical protein
MKPRMAMIKVQRRERLKVGSIPLTDRLASGFPQGSTAGLAAILRLGLLPLNAKRHLFMVSNCVAF